MYVTMYMAAGGIKGLIYLEARACFSVHSGIHFSPPRAKNRLARDYSKLATLRSRATELTVNPVSDLIYCIATRVS